MAGRPDDYGARVSTGSGNAWWAGGVSRMLRSRAGRAVLIIRRLREHTASNRELVGTLGRLAPGRGNASPRAPLALTLAFAVA